MSDKKYQQNFNELMVKVNDLAVELRKQQMIARGLEDRAGADGVAEIADKAQEVHMALEKAVNIVNAIK